MKLIFIWLSLFLITECSFGQLDYTISIGEKRIEGFPALQSYAFGTFSDEVLIVGGRIDGLHKKQPWLSFHQDGRNDSLFVWDSYANTIVSVSLDGLSDLYREQLSASNHEFYQKGDLMCVVGGYGYSKKTDDKITFPAALFFKISEVVGAVKKGSINDGLFKRVEDDRFAVCGGQLEMMNGKYYLVGGHRFDGTYNPMGNPTYDQKYISGFHTFEWDGANVKWGKSYFNEELLHRRDFNLLPGVDSLGNEYLTVVSGVFQKDIDLPYRTAIRIIEDSVFTLPHFSQYFNHYHSAHAAFYNHGQVSHFFFGGIAGYFLDKGEMVQDSNAPFVKTVSALVEEGESMSEWTLPYEMPGFLGSGASFIPVTYLEHRGSGIVDVESLCMRDSVLVGFVFGGISSSMANTFWPEEPSEAYNGIIEIYLKKKPGTYHFSEASSSPFIADVFTNANMDEVHTRFTLTKSHGSDIKFYLTSEPWEFVSEMPSLSPSIAPHEEILEGEGGDFGLMAGEHEYVMKFEDQVKGIHYFKLIVDNVEVFSTKLLVE